MSLSFTSPHMFWLLALLPLLVGVKFLADLRGQRFLQTALSPQLRSQLVTKSNPWREWLVLGLELAGLIAFITALAGPQLGFTEEEVKSSGRSLMLAIDTSRSMLTDDIKPNRLERTKLVAGELIKQLPGDKIGLIAFAGQAYLQAPATQDHAALMESLDQFDTDLIPRGGSNLGEAIDLSVEAFTGLRKDGSRVDAGKDGKSDADAPAPNPTKQTSQALLIFSDGEELEGEAIAAATRAANQGVMIISVGVGTVEGGVIPLTAVGLDMFRQSQQGQSDYVRDDSGKIVKSRLVDKNLIAVANATKGMYVPLQDLIKDERLPMLLQKLEASTNKSKTIRKPVERYQVPLTIACLLLLAALAVRILPKFKANQTTAAPESKLALGLLLGLLVLGSAGPLQAANDVNSLGLVQKRKHDPSHYRRSLRQFQEKLGTQAGQHLAWNWLGEAAVQFAKGEWDIALAAYGEALQSGDDTLNAQAHFGLANTIYRQAATIAKEISAPAKADPSGKPQPAKEPTLEEVTGLVRQLKDSLHHYCCTLEIDTAHKPAQENKKIVESLLVNVEAQQQKLQQEQGKDQKKEEGQGEGQGEGKEANESEEENEGESSGKGEKGGKASKKAGKEGKEEEVNELKEEKGSEAGKAAGEGKAGKEGKEGSVSKEEAAKKDEKGDQRTAEQKKAAEEAAKKANEEKDGKILTKEEKLKKDAQGDKLAKDANGEKSAKDDKGKQQGIQARKVDPLTGYSQEQARRQAQRMADEASLRQQIAPRREAPYKNW